MAFVYLIRDWEQHFEVSQSKQLKNPERARWVAIPNKHDGKSFRRLMRIKDGPAIYGAWILIVQVASKCPTRGRLADEDGPLTAADIADKTGAPVDLIQSALDACCDKAIGWICKESSRSECDVADQEHALGKCPTGQDRTGQEKTIQDAPLPPETGEAAADKKVLFERLKAMGMRAAQQCATAAAKLRSLDVILATLDFYEANFVLPDGTAAFDQAMQFLYWRIAKPECAEMDPAKGWMEPDNQEFLKRKRQAAEEARRATATFQQRQDESRFAAPSPLEIEHGPAVDLLDWDQAIAMLPDGMARALAVKRKREAGPDPPGKFPMIRTALIQVYSQNPERTKTP